MIVASGDGDVSQPGAAVDRTGALARHIERPEGATISQAAARARPVPGRRTTMVAATARPPASAKAHRVDRRKAARTAPPPSDPRKSGGTLAIHPSRRSARGAAAATAVSRNMADATTAQAIAARGEERGPRSRSRPYPARIAKANTAIRAKRSG